MHPVILLGQPSALFCSDELSVNHISHLLSHSLLGVVVLIPFSLPGPTQEDSCLDVYISPPPPPPPPLPAPETYGG